MPLEQYGNNVLFCSQDAEVYACACGCKMYKLISKDDKRVPVFITAFDYDTWTEIYMKMTENEALGKVKM